MLKRKLLASLQIAWFATAAVSLAYNLHDAWHYGFWQSSFPLPLTILLIATIGGITLATFRLCGARVFPRLRWHYTGSWKHGLRLLAVTLPLLSISYAGLAFWIKNCDGSSNFAAGCVYVAGERLLFGTKRADNRCAWLAQRYFRLMQRFPVRDADFCHAGSTDVYYRRWAAQQLAEKYASLGILNAQCPGIASDPIANVKRLNARWQQLATIQGDGTAAPVNPMENPFWMNFAVKGGPFLWNYKREPSAIVNWHAALSNCNISPTAD